MESDVFKREVETRRKALKLSKAALARKAGLKESAVKDIYRDRYGLPKADTLMPLARALDCSPEELLGIGVRIPIVGTVGAGEGVDLIDAYEKGGGLDYIAAPSDLDPLRYVAVRINGDSMAPAYPDKGVAIFRREFEGVHPGAINALAIVCTEDGEAMFKKVTKGRDHGAFDLISLNPQNETRYGVRLHWAAPITRFLYPDLDSQS